MNALLFLYDMYQFLQTSCLLWLLLLMAHALAAVGPDGGGGLQEISPAVVRDVDVATFVPVAAVAASSSYSSTSTTEQEHSSRRRRSRPRLQARQQQAGSSCSDEGQWNCMTGSWQRCAAGRWSVTVPCAKGTTCYPAGLTRDLRIQHDGSVNKNGGPPTTTTTSPGARYWASRIGIWGAVLLWCVG
ncbi:hypothetical protein V2A60_007785 [Cordyceps javanica]|uniref:Uncharacterized protein n=1 Tax=Cordyceps javanica TaxID=43265 RepID=A0A545V9S6_9HYPO|nr:hypothetical protein IF1G_02557 [Cordyceps javanica]TQW09695.1 carbohydrate binding domain (family 19) domain-containing protein [Cordyceps javanica]